jgi:hypothetical protein
MNASIQPTAKLHTKATLILREEVPIEILASHHADKIWCPSIKIKKRYCIDGGQITPLFIRY